MKSLRADDNADVKMIGGVVGILVTLMISILVFYNIAASIDSSSVDTDLQQTGLAGGAATHNYTYAANATGDILDQTATFFTIAPIIAIVVVAVLILQYVGKI